MNQEFSLTVLLSGRGSNLEALIRASEDVPFHINGVVSNRPNAGGLAFAQEASIPTEVVDHTDFECREQFDAALAECVANFKPDLVVLAGFMRILTAGFVNAFAPNLINLHPSILPAYPGLHTHERAIAAGDEMHGSSVHYVDTSLDGGPILMQTVIPIERDDSATSLANRLLPREHALLTHAVELIAGGRVELSDRTVVFDGSPLDKPLRLTPNNEILTHY